MRNAIRKVRLSVNNLKLILYVILVLPDTTSSLRTQEIRPFRKIDDSFKKIVVTKDIVQPHYDEYGILTVNIYDFLLDPQILEK